MTRTDMAKLLAGVTYDQFTGQAGMSRDRYIEEHWTKWIRHADAIHDAQQQQSQPSLSLST